MANLRDNSKRPPGTGAGPLLAIGCGLGYFLPDAFLLQLAATGAAGGFGVGAVAGFIDAMGAQRIGVGGGPTIGLQGGQVALAGQ